MRGNRNPLHPAPKIRNENIVKYDYSKFLKLCNACRKANKTRTYTRNKKVVGHRPTK